MERAAIIGGTGVYGLNVATTPRLVPTPYGEVSLEVLQAGEGEYAGEREIIFLSRHGSNHANPPHLVNYRANMWALQELGVRYVYATAALGSCQGHLRPGDLVLLKDFIDFTKERPATFFSEGAGAVHAIMDDPYCRTLRSLFQKTAKETNVTVAGEGTYVCTEGPRFESAAEIRMFKMLGGDVVGMTNYPEVVLARELQICYATVGMVTNWCTGMGEAVSEDDFLATLEHYKQTVSTIFLKVLGSAALTQSHCGCAGGLLRL